MSDPAWLAVGADQAWNRSGLALLGAECTGKSTLAASLGQHLGVPVLPEQLRLLCERLGRVPNPLEQRELVAAQIQAELTASQRLPPEHQGVARPGWVVDSTPLATALYSLIHQQDDGLIAMAVDHQRRYGLTLITFPDLPWQADGFMRDGPAVQRHFHEVLLQTLEQHHVPYVAVKGQGEDRLQGAIRAVRQRWPLSSL